MSNKTGNSGSSPDAPAKTILLLIEHVNWEFYGPYERDPTKRYVQVKMNSPVIPNPSKDTFLIIPNDLQHITTFVQARPLDTDHTVNDFEWIANVEEEEE